MLCVVTGCVFVLQDRLDGHQLAPSPLADREPSRSGFQPYRPSEEPRPLPPHASPHAAPHAHAPPPFSIDPGAVYSPYHQLYPPHLQQAFRQVG